MAQVLHVEAGTSSFHVQLYPKIMITESRGYRSAMSMCSRREMLADVIPHVIKSVNLLFF